MYFLFIFQERHNYNNCITFYQQTFWIYKLSWIFKIFKKIFTSSWTSLRDHRSQNMRFQVSRCWIQDPRSSNCLIMLKIKQSISKISDVMIQDQKISCTTQKWLYICIMVILAGKFSFEGYLILYPGFFTTSINVIHNSHQTINYIQLNVSLWQNKTCTIPFRHSI